MSVWQTPIGDLHATWFVLGMLVMASIWAIVNIVREWKGH